MSAPKEENGLVVLVSSMSIRYKIAAALIAVLCLAIASLGTISFREQRKTLEAEMRLRAQALARQLVGPAKTALLAGDELAAAQAIADLEKAGVAYAAVVDKKGRVVAQSTAPDPGSLLYEEVPVTVPFHGKLLRAGTVKLALSRQTLVDAIARQKSSFVGITSCFVVVALLISFALGQVMTRRIVVLMTGMKTAAKGDLSHMVEVEARDEIGTLAETFNDMILGLREKLHMEKYLSRSTLELVKKLRDTEVRLGGERRHVAVLFSDIRGFTKLSEHLEPEEVVGLLNIYLNLQAEVVDQRGGVVDKFVGDEVMAIFTGADAEFRAALAAREILLFVRALNETRDRSHQRTMWVGIGLNAGSVIMANMGSERQMDYTVIGDVINTAARLCSSADPGQAVMSRSVAQAAGDRIKRRPMPPVSLKGKSEPVELWELLDAPGAAREHMRRAVDLPAAVRVAGLDGPVSVRLRELGRGGCSFAGAIPVSEPGARLELELPLTPLPGALRAVCVVRHQRRDETGCVTGVEFQDLSQEDLDHLTERVHHVETSIDAGAEA